MQQKYPIYLVSLDRDHQRREQLARMFPSYQNTIQRISAVDGRELPAKEFFGHIFKAMRHGHRLMLPGEVGCTLSHIRALEAFMESGAAAALILEDDIIGGDTDLDTIQGLIPKLPEHGLMICGGQDGMPARKYIFGKSTGTDGLYRIARYSNSHIFRTCCYVVTRTSAQEILQCHETFLRLADAWGTFFEGTDTHIYFANVLSHPEDLNNSHLQHERTLFSGKKATAKRTLTDWLVHRAQRLRRKWGALICRLNGYRRLLPRR